MSDQLPTYKKIVDPNGRPIGLVVVETDTQTTIIERSEAQNRVAFRKVSSLGDALVGGQVLNIEAEEYEDILFGQWKFSISQEVLNAVVCCGGGSVSGLVEDDEVAEVETGEEPNTNPETIQGEQDEAADDEVVELSEHGQAALEAVENMEDGEGEIDNADEADAEDEQEDIDLAEDETGEDDEENEDDTDRHLP